MKLSTAWRLSLLVPFVLVTACAVNAGLIDPDNEDDTSLYALDYDSEISEEEQDKNSRSWPFACGEQVRDERGNVLQFEGTPVISNGPNIGTGRSCGSSASGVRPAGRNMWQCVEFVERYLRDHYNIDANAWTGNAAYKLGTASRVRGLEPIDNGTASQPPVPGDAIIWGATDGNPYGHIALAVEVGRDYVRVLDQNVPVRFARRLEWNRSSGRLSSGGWSNPVIGWVHASANTGRRAAGQAGGWSSGGGTTPTNPDGISCRRDHGYRCTSDRTQLYRCDDGTPTVHDCPAGCRDRWIGADSCIEPEQPSAPPMSGTSTTEGVGEDCSYGSRRGSCIDTDEQSCGGDLVSGLCPGPNSVRCCLPSSGSTSTPQPQQPSASGVTCSRANRNWTCTDDDRAVYRCDDSVPTVYDCPAGCRSRIFAADYCEESASGSSSGGSSSGTTTRLEHSGSVRQGEVDQWHFEVTGAGRVTVELTPSGGDLDLFVGNDSSYETFHCQSRNSGTAVDSCTINVTGAGNLFVEVDGYESGSYDAVVTID